MSFYFVSRVIILADSILPMLYLGASLPMETISGWFSCFSFLFTELGIVFIISSTLFGLIYLILSKLILLYSILLRMYSMLFLAPKLLSIWSTNSKSFRAFSYSSKYISTFARFKYKSGYLCFMYFSYFTPYLLLRCRLLVRSITHLLF